MPAPLIAALLPTALTLASSFAPKLLGSLFGDKAEKVAGDVVNIATGITGISDPETALKKIQEDSAFQLKFQAQANEYALGLAEIEMADVQDARRREREIVQATGKSDYNLYFMAWLIIIGFFVLVGLLFKYQIEGNEVVMLLFGALVAGFTQVISYFFGSSRSSKDKTRLMANGR